MVSVFIASGRSKWFRMHLFRIQAWLQHWTRNCSLLNIWLHNFFTSLSEELKKCSKVYQKIFNDLCFVSARGLRLSFSKCSTMSFLSLFTFSHCDIPKSSKVNLELYYCVSFSHTQKVSVMKYFIGIKIHNAFLFF